MKILMLCDFFNENLEYQENLLVKYYLKHGHRVTVIASTFESVFDYYADRHDNTVPGRVFESGGAKIIKLRYSYNLLNRLRAYTPIKDILQNEQPDLIYVHDIMLNFPECVDYVRCHPSCKMIMDYHADRSNSGKNWLSLSILHGVFRKWFLDRARPYLSRIFPIVPASATFLHEIYKVPYADMELLPLGADTDLVQAIAGDERRKELRAKYGISEDDVAIVTGGKLTPAKRTELLLEVVGLLPRLKLKVIVIGDTSDSEVEYRHQLESYAINNKNIIFVGWLGREDIYHHFNMADLAVFPASQSILWQQAIAAGLPLIAGDIGHQDISYLNLHENIVILRDSAISAAGLATAINDILGTPDRLLEMSEGAKRVAEELLNWNKLVGRTLQFNINAVSSNN
jgi:glycosyltransferase involved in cell wall biosynthesis